MAGVTESLRKLLRSTGSLAAANNEFSLAAYAQLTPHSRNLFFSPVSLRIALAMAEAGARGPTASQMRTALCLSSDEEGEHAAMTAIVRQLNVADDSGVEIAVANSLWLQEGAPVQQAFLDMIARRYGGTAHRLDFRRVSESARAINSWVKDQTRQKIRELISAGALSDATRLVLANAIYFKGMWDLPFRSSATFDQPFYAEDGGAADVPLMHQRATFPYWRGSDYQAVDLAYRGGNVSMLVLLPDRKDGLRNLESTLSARMLDSCVSRLERRKVLLMLPRFAITWGGSMKDALIALGMSSAFSLEADFSGINGCRPPDDEALSVSDVLHRAVVETNEKGTEAAAATAVATNVTASLGQLETPVFRADHPFLFVIRDRKSGTILFLGRLGEVARNS